MPAAGILIRSEPHRSRDRQLIGLTIMETATSSVGL